MTPQDNETTPYSKLKLLMQRYRFSSIAHPKISATNIPPTQSPQVMISLSSPFQQKCHKIIHYVRPSQIPSGRFAFALSCCMSSVFRYRLVLEQYQYSLWAVDAIKSRIPDGRKWAKMHHFLGRCTDSIGARYYRQLENCHRKCSKTIAKRLKLLGGIYAKVGQSFLSFDHIMPDVYLKRLKVLTDDLTPSPFGLSGLLEEIQSLGFRRLEDVFHFVSPLPFATGSIAQVHLARLHGFEQPVCIKIQHPQIVYQMKGDFAALELIIKLIERNFPDVKMISVFKRLNTALAQECDFRQEAFNSIRYQSLLSSPLVTPHFNLGWDLPVYLHRRWNEWFHQMPTVQVKVPEVFWPLCTERALVMEYVSNSSEKRADVFLPKNSDWANNVRDHVANCYMDTTTKMLFRIGFLHCDMHLGNVLFDYSTPSKSHRNGHVDVYVIDHGMMRRMDETTRAAIVSLADIQLRNDVVRGVKLLRDMKWIPPLLHADQVFATISLLMNESEMIGGDLTEFVSTVSSAVADDQPGPLLNSKVIRAWMGFLQELPTDMYWFLRSLSLNRHIHRTLGGSLNSRLSIMGANALQYGGHFQLVADDGLDSCDYTLTELNKDVEGTITSFMTNIISRKNWPTSRPNAVLSYTTGKKKFVAGRFDLPPLIWRTCTDPGTRSLNCPTKEERTMWGL